MVFKFYYQHMDDHILQHNLNNFTEHYDRNWTCSTQYHDTNPTEISSTLFYNSNLTIESGHQIVVTSLPLNIFEGQKYLRGKRREKETHILFSRSQIPSNMFQQMQNNVK